VLVAIDDLHWLDAVSAEALAFAARRVEGDGIASRRMLAADTILRADIRPPRPRNARYRTRNTSDSTGAFTQRLGDTEQS